MPKKYIILLLEFLLFMLSSAGIHNSDYLSFYVIQLKLQNKSEKEANLPYTSAKIPKEFWAPLRGSWGKYLSGFSFSYSNIWK